MLGLVSPSVISDVPTYGLRRGEVLCLSGSGYRAALFHLGALTRLNELGLLARTDVVGAVAGGSLLAALLATRVPWPLHGAFREWPEVVAEPMRAIAQRNLRARALLRSPFSGSATGAALEERYARELAEADGSPGEGRPRLVFGGAGLALAEMASGEAGRRQPLRWDFHSAAETGYDPMLVSDVIAAVRTDLDAFGEAEQAVLENHGYLLADAAVREASAETAARLEPLPPAPPHPGWMNELRVRRALAASARRTALGRLRPRRAERVRQTVESPGDEPALLLERYRPLIQYDSLESYRADSVASVVSLAMGQRCNTLHRADGTVIAAALPPENGEAAVLDLDFLSSGSYANGEPVRDDDYLDESGGSHAADALAMRRRQGCADVAYGRSCRDGDGRLWLQYWFFYYFNDKGFLHAGIHEGDWEMVQLRIGDGDAPDAVTYGQHSGGVRASWEEAEKRRDGREETLVLYSARGSHACLPRAGTYAAPAVPDHSDGLGLAVRPRLERIGTELGWIAWPGHWGSTRRREAFEGTSPRGPAQQAAWLDPAEFHREARPSEEVSPWRLKVPPAPELTARREGGSAVVSYCFPGPHDEGGRAERIVAAPHRAGETEPLRTQTFKVEGPEGSIAVQLPPHAEYEGVRLSVASELGTPGETLTALFEQ
jgi:hypothetical protein